MSGVTHSTLDGRGAHRDNESSCDRMTGYRRANLNYLPRPAQTPSRPKDASCDVAFTERALYLRVSTMVISIHTPSTTRCHIHPPPPKDTAAEPRQLHHTAGCRLIYIEY
ncbi:hypothetical protein E2C01_093383 [Portunus trituberculatus]|uniref:Uncharacterized protein n=1 Tax=Portunus trituberculatus TaxID=210409 RepID=A0A5B7JUA4_PORTR|nr:hypothetical protein [Portunus trituberculatus]